MWPSVVVHEHWPVSQRMIVKIWDYAWSEHIVTVFLACQITIKNVQVQLTVKGKTTRQLHSDTQKQLCPKCGCPEMKCFVGAKPLHDRLLCVAINDFHQTSGPVTMCEWSTPNDHVTSQIEHGDDVMSTVNVLWVVALAFPDGGGV